MSYPLLDTITCPADIALFDKEKLNRLCDEVRQRIIEVLSKNGGHLASNLGAVELTVALHKTFNSPVDKFLWDTSHQTYTHKLLTGRHKNFETLRKTHGLTGFSNPSESEHDIFYAGHAGTALSMALGLAENRNHCGRDEHIIPVIGDGSLTCGLILEALNNIPAGLKKFIVILNDNTMAISENAGAISSILSRLVNNPKLDKFYHEVENFLNKIPSVGSLIAKKSKKVKGSLQNIVSPSLFFEQYHMSYFGPFDGNDVEQLVNVFEEVKNYDRPVLIHIITKKGLGMDEAAKNPTAYHGVKPFHPDTGKFLPEASAPTFPTIFGEQLVALGKQDTNLAVVTPAMLAGSSLEEFQKSFPDRCYDVGIAEGHAVTFSGALAYRKKLNVVSVIYSTFLQRAFDNVFHDICLQKLPILFGVDRAGFAGADGATHHGLYDIAFLNSMPSMVIAQPRDGRVLRELMVSAFSWNRPTAIRYPNKTTIDDNNSTPKQRTLGKGEILADGDDVVIIALGHMCTTAFEVRTILEKQGISAAIIDPVFVKPLDTELFHDTFKTHRYVVTIEEHTLIGGLGSIINNFIVTNGYHALSVINCGVGDIFIEQGSYADLLDEAGLSPDKIATNIIEHLP